MNGDILKKAIDELEKKDPRIDYVRGILETLYDLDGGTKPVIIGKPIKKKPKVEEEDPEEDEIEESDDADLSDDDEVPDDPPKKSAFPNKRKTPEKPLSPDEKEARNVPAMRLTQSKEEVRKRIEKFRKENPEVTPNGVAIALKLSPITVEKLWEE